MLDPVGLLQLSLFEEEASLSKRGPHERCFLWRGSGLAHSIRLCWKSLLGTTTIAYFPLIRDNEKSFITFKFFFLRH